ncbi:hypothetical protein FNF28_05977 [Cafeteria roenbergensis]|nr:hypothetical protein FNF28_05977 [Cafeteria roenbergensis]
MHPLAPAELFAEAGAPLDTDRAVRCLLDWITVVSKWRTMEEEEEARQKGARTANALASAAAAAAAAAAAEGGEGGSSAAAAAAAAAAEAAEAAAAEEEEAAARRAHSKDRDDIDEDDVGGAAGPIVSLEAARKELAAVSPEEFAALVRDPAPSLAAMLAVTCICVLAGERPTWACAQALLRETSAATQTRLLSLRREDVPNKARHMMATMLAARRMTSLTPGKLEAMGPALGRIYGWITAILSVEGMSLARLPQPRSARRSADRFVAALLAAARDEGRSTDAGSGAADRETAASIVRRAGGSAVSGMSGSAGGAAADDQARLLSAVNTISGWGSFGRESLALMAVRASLRASAWRAKARVRRWQELGVMRLLGGTSLGRARRGLLDLSGKDVDAFRNQKPFPPPEALAIASAMGLLLQEEGSWKFCRRLLRDQSVLEFLCELSPGNIQADALVKAREALMTGGPKGGPIAESVRACNLRATKALHRWLLRFTEPEGSADGAGAAGGARARPSDA